VAVVAVVELLEALETNTAVAVEAVVVVELLLLELFILLMEHCQSLLVLVVQGQLEALIKLLCLKEEMVEHHLYYT
jgi:hypothetical protein